MYDVEKILLPLIDEKYKSFNSRLIPNISPEKMLGVRVPELRKIAKMIYSSGEFEAFAQRLPHEYYEENLIHAYMISHIKDYDEMIKRTEQFLPYTDNWAVCDGIIPKVGKVNRDDFHEKVDLWLMSDEVYTARFALNMLMKYYLEDGFDVEQLYLVSQVKGEDYYLKMGVAFYYATALAKHYDEVLSFLKEGHLEKWTHNKTIQKAIESFRITDEQKAELRGLKK